MFAISRLTPSVAPDAAESTKRRLATQGKSSQALTFADLYTKFASKTGPESVNNKWAVLYLLKIISEDRKSVNSQLDSSVLLPNFGLNNAGSGGESRVLGGRGSGEKGRSNGVLLVSKDPENLGEIAFREFVNLVKEENELSEEALVRDVLYACQGIDGKYQSEVFAVAFAVLAAGAVILTLNVLLLGGHIIFFQSLSLLGYCLFPLDVGALICMVKDNVILKVVVVSITLAWSSWSAYPFMSSAVNPRRKALALYPVFLLYVSVGFLLKMQDGHILVIL